VIESDPAAPPVVSRSTTVNVVSRSGSSSSSKLGWIMISLGATVTPWTVGPRSDGKRDGAPDTPRRNLAA
jgi:hypothetical protein